MHKKMSSVKFYLEGAWVSTFQKWWVQIYEYLNKMTLKYYFYLYLCYFSSMNIFGCPRDFWSKDVFLILACNDAIKQGFSGLSVIKYFFCFLYWCFYPHWFLYQTETFSPQDLEMKQSIANTLYTHGLS